MQSIREMIRQFMSSRLNMIQTDLANGLASAELSKLRRGIGRRPGDMPELWGMIFENIPGELMSSGGEPTKAEWAIYSALTMYALHQQGKSESVHKSGEGLGKAIAGLVESKEDQPRITRRFNAFATASDIQELGYHLRGMVQLLKGSELPVDYVQLASDLYDYQWDDESRSRVRLRWGQDYYRYLKSDKEKTEE